jgi:hypothetical protein
MRILLDQGIFDMRNTGQNAMLQVVVERVCRFWPDASIHITTVAPNILKIYFPEAYPVSRWIAWFQNPGRYRIKQMIPAYILKLLLETRKRSGIVGRNSYWISAQEAGLLADGGKNIALEINTTTTRQNHCI